MKLNELQQKHPRLIYESFSHEVSGGDFHISFSFRLAAADGEDIVFTPKTVIHAVDAARVESLDRDLLDNLVFNLGMVETISYWKAACPPQLVVRVGALSSEQILWWLDMYRNGLGEFYAVNNLDFVVPEIVIESIKPDDNTDRAHNTHSRPRSRSIELQDRTLVPVGGGKDSVLTLEAFKNQPGTAAFFLNEGGGMLPVTKVAGIKTIIRSTRAIDPQLRELNERGYLNGHTPFSVFLGFLSVLVGVLFDYKHIALSNEKSADEPTMEYRGVPVNHQFAKSREAERQLQSYIATYISPDPHYYSYLRDLTELEIFERFARMPQYHDVFLSCNNAYRDGTRWCNNCAKCLFTYIGLSAFMEPHAVERILGKNLLKDESLAPLLEQMTNPQEDRPFECIGTREETQKALKLAGRRRV